MSAVLEQGRAGGPLDIDVVDMHAHLGRFSFTIPDLDVASFVAAMDRVGVSASICSHMRAMSIDVEEGNAEIAKAMAAYPGRVLGYVAVYPFDPLTVRHSVERWVAEGFSGLKLHNLNGFSYADPAYAPALAIASDKGLPVLLHTWGDEKVMGEVLAISARYPGAAFLLAHAGAMNPDIYVSVARRRDNVYLEIAGSASPMGLVERFVRDVGAEKVVFGSDVYFLDQAQQVGRVAGANIPEEAKVMVFGGNARRILQTDRGRR